MVVGREHHAEGGEDHVEARVRIRQVLGVRHLEGDVEAFRFRAAAAALEERGNVVGGGHGREAAGRGQGRVAVAGGHVEHALARLEVDGLAQELADDLEGRPDHGEVAGRPHGLLPALDRGRTLGLDGIIRHCARHELESFLEKSGG